MRASLEKIDITEFSDYKKVPGQYRDSFIIGSRCVKLNEDEKVVTVALSESFKEKKSVLDKVHAGKQISAVLIKDSQFAEFIGNYVETSGEKNSSTEKTETSFSLEDISGEAPAVNAINAICLEAIRRKASDIHIQSEKDLVNVRMRIDGLLQNVRTIDKGLFSSIVSRIKVMAGLNVMENRLCQDGRITVQTDGKKLDFRVSVVPAVSGQNIVLRLFNFENEALSLDELGFSSENLKEIKKAMNLPFGMILATGPTGSGKSTTLHAMLREMDKDHLKIVTIEDPVEKQIEGIEQIQVNAEIGLTFESLLRRILRHDPDVIMVGEIRDRETAELAVRSALTGHLILSTLHTNDSVSSITRLKNLGIEPYLISGVLRTCIAQRLVRKLCNSCGGKGCEVCCYTGYKGRTAVSEVFSIDETCARMIEEQKNDSEIRSYLKQKGIKFLRQDALLKVKAGISTKQEMIREGLL